MVCIRHLCFFSSDWNTSGFCCILLKMTRCPSAQIYEGSCIFPASYLVPKIQEEVGRRERPSCRLHVICESSCYGQQDCKKSLPSLNPSSDFCICRDWDWVALCFLLNMKKGGSFLCITVVLVFLGDGFVWWHLVGQEKLHVPQEKKAQNCLW